MKKLLLELGFSEKEADVYIMLNTLGPSAASVLARLTKIPRTSMYDILGSLESKGLITSYQQGKSTFFAIDDLKKLVALQKDRITVAEAAYDQLRAESQKDQQIQVSYYKGVEAVKDLYKDILLQPIDEFCVWIKIESLYQAFDPVYDSAWTLKRVAQGIYARLLMQDSPGGRKFKRDDADLYRETILLPEDCYFESSCFIYGGQVCFFDMEGEITGIRIKNPHVYEMHKSIFEMYWKTYGGGTSKERGDI